MILAVDIGNTNIVLGCIENDEILFEARMATDLIKTSDQYCAELKTMLPKLHSTNYPGMELIRPLYLVREADILAWKRYNDLRFLQCACRFTEQDESETSAGHGARGQTKELVRLLRQMNPKADINIFHSLHNANLNMLPGYTLDGKLHSFLDEYDS